MNRSPMAVAWFTHSKAAPTSASTWAGDNSADKRAAEYEYDSAESSIPAG